MSPGQPSGQAYRKRGVPISSESLYSPGATTVGKPYR
jgi:hypothetical protein